VQCYREYIGIGTTVDDHLRILITARFTTGEILRAYDMPSCIVDDEIYDDRDKHEDDDMCSEVCEHNIHVNLRILITARFTTPLYTRRVATCMSLRCMSKLYYHYFVFCFVPIKGSETPFKLDTQGTDNSMHRDAAGQGLARVCVYGGLVRVVHV
jgi:hypothetical protein